MSDISKHESEQIRKGNYSKETWVDLSVPWNSIGINYLLERTQKVRLFEVSRRLVSFGYKWLSFDINAKFVLVVHFMNKLLEFIDIFLRNKNLSLKKRFVNKFKFVSSLIYDSLHFDINLNFFNRRNLRIQITWSNHLV